jgi:hypothetical protein
LRTLSKKQKATVAAVTLLGLGGTAGIAYAYWTTTGSGSGNQLNAASNGTVTLHASWNDAALTPGGSQTVSFTADNPGTTNLYVGTIHSVVSTSPSSCLAGDFTIPDVAANQVIPAGSSGLAILATGTLSFANTAVSQDTCKSATVTLTLSSN